MSTPQSIIRILDVPLNSRYEHTYFFESKAEQSAFFNSKVIKTFTAYSYVRKSWDLQVQTTMETAKTWRYLTFRNTSSGKDYYYFITNIEYVNDSNVRLTLEIDVMQTYMFDYGLEQCFVDRQHTETDEIGEHTIDEGLELGKLYDYHQWDMEDLQKMCVLILSAVKLTATTADECVTVYGREYDDVFSGMAIYATDSRTVFGNLLTRLNTWGKIDGIAGMWMYPKNLVKLANGASWSTSSVVEVDSSSLNFGGLATYDTYNDKIFEGYKPQNNKLYCYPFNFLYVTNNGGKSAVYRFEHWEGLNANGAYPFALYGALSPDAGVKLCPASYGGEASVHYDEGLTINGFPSVAWNSDTYKVWLAQNQHSQELAITQAKITAGGGALTAVASVATGSIPTALAGLGTAYHGLSQVQGILAQRADMEVQPAHAAGSYSANVNVANNRQTFSFYYRCLRKEYARVIDEYLTRYGYTCKRVRIPNRCARSRYTFIKTIGCHIRGNLCSEDQNKICSIYDNGITFWRDRDLIGTYGNNNVL